MRNHQFHNFETVYSISFWLNHPGSYHTYVWTAYSSALIFLAITWLFCNCGINCSTATILLYIVKVLIKSIKLIVYLIYKNIKHFMVLRNCICLRSQNYFTPFLAYQVLQNHQFHNFETGYSISLSRKGSVICTILFINFAHSMIGFVFLPSMSNHKHPSNRSKLFLPLIQCSEIGVI